MARMEFRPAKILLTFWLAGALFACLPLGGIIAAVLSSLELGVVKLLPLAILLPALLTVPYTILFFKSVRYELDDAYISTESGVLWKQKRTVPLEKITNFDVRQGPLERALGFGEIWIFTPSTGSMIPEVKLTGIVAPHEMKQTIQARSDRAKNPAAAPAPDSRPASGDPALALLAEIRDSLRRIEASLARKEG